jgi:trigger factor
LVPKYEEPVVEPEEIESRLKRVLEAQTLYRKLKEDRPLQNGDQAVFDFVGTIDGKKFDGGEAKGFELIIGSGQFIPGFEEQMVGMNRGESRDIKVTFPENYQSKDLAGREVQFNITLHDIKSRGEIKLDDEMVKRLMPGDESATPESVKKRIEEEIKSEKIYRLYNDRLKSEFIDALISKYDFDLPENIIEQEIDEQVNQKAMSMTKEEFEEYKNNQEKLNELRESLRDEAINSVKATFLVDVMAKKEEIDVSDDEMIQVIYNEAIMSRQDPQKLIDYYREKGLFPAIKMGLIEKKLLFKIMNLD